MSPFVLDPGAGDGALGRVAQKMRPAAHLTGVELDPALSSLGYNRWIVYDFLELPVTNERAPDLIICNPPFSLALEFIDRSFEWAGARTVVAFLLRIDFLGSQKRHEWWDGMYQKPKLRILSKRPSFTGDGKTDSSNYMWAIWGLPYADPLRWYRGEE